MMSLGSPMEIRSGRPIGSAVVLAAFLCVTILSHAARAERPEGEVLETRRGSLSVKLTAPCPFTAGQKVELSYMAGVMEILLGLYQIQSVEGDRFQAEPLSVTVPPSRGMKVIVQRHDPLLLNAEAQKTRAGGPGTQALPKALTEAVEKGDLNALRTLVRDGADVNARDTDGYSLLHMAAAGGYHDMAAWLVSKGADVKAATRFGETPLHVVKDRRTAEVLVAAGADVNARDSDFGMTPLFRHGKGVAELLISRGADVNARSTKGTPLITFLANSNAREVIALIISKGADVNAGAGVSKTALHNAANWGFKELALLLLRNGADSNAKDGSGWTPLHWAAFEGGPEMVQWLIRQGADKNAKTSGDLFKFPAGSTPLDIVELSGPIELVPYLKALGCKRGKELK